MATATAMATALGLEVSGRGIPSGTTLGERLEALRKLRGLSRNAVAVMGAISIPAITQVERTNDGHVSTFEAVARALGASLSVTPDGQRSAFLEAGTSTGNHEWYTPGWLIERVVAAVGDIDLDPCSPGRGRTPVQADTHFTAADDGLKHDWFGRVYLNPPYGPTIGRWLAKARQELANGNARTVVALVPARTDTRWWHGQVSGIADVLLLKGRVCFSGSAVAAPFPSALAGYGLTEAERDALMQAFPDAWHVPVRR
jgi:transcriptional regulator with XRE-family HTH domain